MLLIHIFIAISSIALTTLAYFNPSYMLLRLSYGLAAATFATGTVLVATAPSHILQACLSGVVYLTAVSVGIAATRVKLVQLQTATAKEK